MKNIIRTTLIVTSVLVAFVAVASLASPLMHQGVASAQTVQTEVCNSIGGCDNNPNNGATLTGAVNLIVNILSVILGTAAVIMLILGGIKYTTSGGDSNAVSSAKNTIIYSLVGLAVAVLAKPLVNLILNNLT